jgi:hypothetical protein
MQQIVSGPQRKRTAREYGGVAEAGWSELIGKLEQDVLFWLRESQQ